jgi:hypothetical protein
VLLALEASPQNETFRYVRPNFSTKHKVGSFTLKDRICMDQSFAMNLKVREKTDLEDSFSRIAVSVSRVISLCHPEFAMAAFHFSL